MHLRSVVRAVSALWGAGILGYMYLSYLLHFDWTQFGVHELPEGHPRKLHEYIWLGNLQAGFLYLQDFSLSGAMLPYSKLYTYGLGPVLLLQLALEYDRILWLKRLIYERTSYAKDRRVISCLDTYFKCALIGFISFLFLGVFDIEQTIPHYVCAGVGLLFVTVAICSYIRAFGPGDLACQKSADESLRRWSSNVRKFELPTLRAVLILTAICFASAAWKTDFLGDDRRSLVFGVLETTVILGYQAMFVAFTVNDHMIDLDATQQSDKSSKLSASHINEPSDIKGPEQAEPVPETLMGS